jgi:hypothetical protein
VTKPAAELVYVDDSLYVARTLKRHIQRVARLKAIRKSELSLSYFFFAKSLKSLEATRTLWAARSFQDAAIVARTVFELCVQHLYIRTDPGQLSARYFAHEPLARRDCSANIIKSATIKSAQDKRVMGRWIASARKYGRMTKRSPYIFNEKANWSGKSVREIVKILNPEYPGLWSDYETFYAISSGIVHSTAMSIQEYMRLDSTGYSYRELSVRRPYLAHVPLVTASWCLAVGMLVATDHNIVARDFDLARATLDARQLLETLKWAIEK